MRNNKPEAVTIPKAVQKTILKQFAEDTKDAKKLASWNCVPRPQVMLFLEQMGLRSYSPGSYCC